MPRSTGIAGRWPWHGGARGSPLWIRPARAGSQFEDLRSLAERENKRRENGDERGQPWGDAVGYALKSALLRLLDLASKEGHAGPLQEPVRSASTQVEAQRPLAWQHQPV